MCHLLKALLEIDASGDLRNYCNLVLQKALLKIGTSSDY